MAKISRARRLLRILTLPKDSQVRSVDDLANELKVSRRTVFRDLNALDDLTWRVLGCGKSAEVILPAPLRKSRFQAGGPMVQQDQEDPGARPGQARRIGRPDRKPDNLDFLL
jgi:DNA-binding transcriptional MocR family regulator